MGKGTYEESSGDVKTADCVDAREEEKGDCGCDDADADGEERVETTCHAALQNTTYNILASSLSHASVAHAFAIGCEEVDGETYEATNPIYPNNRPF